VALVYTDDIFRMVRRTVAFRHLSYDFRPVHTMGVSGTTVVSTSGVPTAWGFLIGLAMSRRSG
jgi:hypothetical protein